MLTGTEVKSLRIGKAQITEAYVSPERGELWLINAHIPEYLQANRFNHEEQRPRKLLVSKKELARFSQDVAAQRQHHRAAEALFQRARQGQAADRPRQGQEELRQARDRERPRLEPRKGPHHEELLRYGAAVARLVEARSAARRVSCLRHPLPAAARHHVLEHGFGQHARCSCCSASSGSCRRARAPLGQARARRRGRRGTGARRSPSVGQQRVVGDAAERPERPAAGAAAIVGGEELPAGRDLGAGRLVLRRHAAHGVGDQHARASCRPSSGRCCVVAGGEAELVAASRRAGRRHSRR